MSCSAVLKVLRTTCVVSDDGHSHAMSMCEFPTTRTEYCFSTGSSAPSFPSAAVSDASNAF